MLHAETDNPNKLAYGISEAGEAIGKSRWTIHRLIRDGELTASIVRGRRVIMKEALIKMLRKGQENFIREM